MRILVLTIEYPPLGGGASPVTHEINKNYVLAGHAVHVVTMSFEGLNDEEVMDGVFVHRLRCGRSEKHISHPKEHLYFLFAARQFLNKFLLVQQFNVCHTHFILPTGLLARWVRKKFDIPYIITSHGSDIPGFNPDRFKLLHLFTPLLIKSIVRNSAGIVAPSQYLATLIRKIKGISGLDIRIIPNGIDTDQFVPGKKSPIILSSGRLLARKGFQHLIAAVSHEQMGYEVHIAGDGPMMEKLKAQAATSKTPVIFHGWLDNRGDKYQDLIRTASIFCLLSTKENASISLLEALSTGCAIITSNATGCPETIGNAGVCVTPDDIEALHDVLKRLITEDEYRNSLMKAARERAVHHFHWPLITKKYLELLQAADTK